jgi:hypothetical protein
VPYESHATRALFAMLQAADMSPFSPGFRTWARTSRRAEAQNAKAGSSGGDRRR